MQERERKDGHAPRYATLRRRGMTPGVAADMPEKDVEEWLKEGHRFIDGRWRSKQEAILAMYPRARRIAGPP
eukprot:4754561-Lingulodinium_polyedra.AAC.1